MVGLVYARTFSNDDNTAGTAYIIGSEYIPDANGEVAMRMTGYTEFNIGENTTTNSNQLRMQAI
jgi:hypothetical protein